MNVHARVYTNKNKQQFRFLITNIQHIPGVPGMSDQTRDKLARISQYSETSVKVNSQLSTSQKNLKIPDRCQGRDQEILIFGYYM